LDTAGGKVLRHIEEGAFSSPVFDVSGKFVYVINDKLLEETIKVISTESEDADADLACRGLSSFSSKVKCSPDGRYFAATTLGDDLRLWETKGLAYKCDLKHQGFVRDFEFHLTDPVVGTTGDDYKARVWSLETGQETAFLQLDRGGNRLSMHPSKPLLSVSVSNIAKVWLWDYRNNQVLKVYEHETNVRDQRISPCGQYLAVSTNDFRASIWRLANGGILHQFQHFDTVNSLCFSSDGSLLLTASSDKTVRVWDVKTGGEIARIGRNQAVLWAAFGPDDRWIVLRYWDTFAEILYWKAADLIEIAGQRLTSNLSLSGWRRYLEDEPYNPTFPHLPAGRP
jgi:WD40 repeat protein